MINRKTKKIFFKRIIPISLELMGGPLKTRGVIKQKESYWTSYNNNNVFSFFMENFNYNIKNININDEIKHIMDNWEKYNEEEKIIIFPLIKEIISMKEIGKIMIGEEYKLSEYLYEMY